MTRALLTAALVGTLASGCMSAELARVHRDVSAEMPGLGDGHAFQMGRLTMALAGRFVGDGDEARAALRSVRGVAVGTYALPRLVDAEALVLPGLSARLARRGWAPVVASREDGEAAFLYTRVRGDVLRDLLVVALDGDEMTLVRVNGRFDEASLAALTGSDGLLGDAGPALRRVFPATGG